MRRVVSNLDQRWLAAASSALCSHLADLLKREFPKDGVAILAWTSFFPGEPDLSSFISGSFGQYDIFLPKTYPDYSMKFVSVSDKWSEETEPGEFGIPVPTGGNFFDPASYSTTVVLVPGLAYDSLGNRLGRGKGHYDRFLGQPELRAAKKIGICWSLQIVDEVPAESHDIPVDWLCTEEGVSWGAPKVIEEI